MKGLGNSPSLYDEAVEEFVDNGVLRLEKYCNFSDFGAIVSVESSKSPSLVDVIRGYLMEYVPKPIVSFQLIKNLYKDVQFDKDRAVEALRSIGYEESEIKEEINFTIKKFDELKKSGQLFQMKRFIPKAIRSGFYDFLKFKAEKERKVYEALQGVDVLVYDDFLTSGSTVKEIIRYLRAIHDKNSFDSLCFSETVSS